MKSSNKFFAIVIVMAIIGVLAYVLSSPERKEAVMSKLGKMKGKAEDEWNDIEQAFEDEILDEEVMASQN